MTIRNLEIGDYILFTECDVHSIDNKKGDIGLVFAYENNYTASIKVLRKNLLDIHFFLPYNQTYGIKIIGKAKEYKKYKESLHDN